MRVIDVNTVDSTTVVLKAAEVLAAGGLVIFPTETTYGAGVLATNQAAVDKLLAYKARREGKPLSIAVTDQAMAERYVEVNDQAAKLYQQFLPGPVTVISTSKHVVANGVESEYGTLGIRIPDYQLVLDLVAKLDAPITSTSANGSGEKRPYTIQDIMDGLSEKQKSLIDLVLDAGELPHNPPSTVIDTTLSTPVVFRQGDIKAGASLNAAALDLTSNSEQATKDIAARLLLKHWDDIKTTGLVIGLDGSLGMGKTVFTKGVADWLNITDTITSPTYTYIEEYDWQRHGHTGKLCHLDVWKVETPEQLERLEVGSLLKPGAIVVIEWFSQVSESLIPVIKNKGLPIVTVAFAQPSTIESTQRQLTVHEIETTT